MAARVSPERHLVVIGASAGGIVALSTLVATLPAGFPAPIVVAQHLDPTHASHLAEILGRHSTVPVQTASDRDPLHPGVLYVVPSNRQVELADGGLVVQEDRAERLTPSIDRLFSSAAAAYGERLIAVILSGTGSDGAAGARMVKHAGGVVIIQDPASAAYPGMPLSLAPTTVDIIAPLDRLGGILRDLVAGMPVPPHGKMKHTLEAFLEEVRSHVGLDFTSYKLPTLLRRLHRRIVATQTETLEGYTQYLATHPEEYPQLIHAFLITVTEFFRDPEVCAYLREEVLPTLIREARARNRELRIWSAGCATGEEAYSLAILLAEALGSELDQFNVRIFATDVDAEAVAVARRGVYPVSALSGVPDDLVERSFSQEGNHAQVRKRVRSLIVFGVHDLAQRAPFPEIDLVLCRNVLIYFAPELQQRTLHLFAYSLREGGYLVLGKAESIGPLAGFFAPQHPAFKVYRRQGDHILLLASRFSTPPPEPPQPLARTRAPQPGGAFGLPSQAPSPALPLTERGWRQAPVGLVVLDRHYDIQAINRAAREYLRIRGAAVGEDILHLIQVDVAAILRTAIDQALQRGEAATVEAVPVEHLATDQPRYLEIRCQPLRSEDEPGPVEEVLLVLAEVTALVERRRLAEQQFQEARTEREQLERAHADTLVRQEHLIGRLREANRQLEEANQELTSTNETLQSTTEGLLLHTEEAQAATEEVETLNEELQATNEELETLNEELQSTIEELHTTNADLHARGQEVQELARTREAERAQLEAMLASMPSAVLVVNREGGIVLTNPAYAELFGAPSAPLLARDAAGKLLAPADTPCERAAQGEAFRMEFTLTAEDGTHRWYEAIGQPIRTSSGDQHGGVVVLRAIPKGS